MYVNMMNLTLLFICVLLLSLLQVYHTLLHSKSNRNTNAISTHTTTDGIRYNIHSFQKNDNENDSTSGSSSDKMPWYKKLLRFLPDTSKAKMEKTYNIPQYELGNRYMVRLIQPKMNDRRHCITRLMRYLPDLTYETAAVIVDTATSDGVSLVRVYNSLKDAEYLCDMLRKADPSINCNIYDSKKDELLSN